MSIYKYFGKRTLPNQVSKYHYFKMTIKSCKKKNFMFLETTYCARSIFYILYYVYIGNPIPIEY